MQSCSSHRAAAVAVGLLILGGCSGEDLIESGIEEAIERSAESEGANDVELDLDAEDGSFSMEIDGAEAQVGSDLAVPEWVPDGFPLPDDLDISMAVVEDGRSVFSGTSSAPAAPLREEIMDWLQRNGYDVLVDTTGEERFNFVAARGDDVLEGNHGLGGFMLSADQRDVTYERQDAAPVREGPGNATVSVGGIDAELTGTCRIQGGDYHFEHTDLAASANLSVFAVGDQPPQGSAFVMTSDPEAGEFIQYSINFPMGNDDEPQASTGENTFGVEGTWFDMLGGEPVQGAMRVTCDL